MPVGTVLSASATTATWNGWVTQSSTTSSATVTVWGAWLNGGTGANTATAANAPDPDLLARWEAQRAEREAQWEAERAEREAAQAMARARAEETLRAVLDPEQWESWQREQRFELITQSGQRYRIRRGVSGNVRLIEDGEEREALCAHPPTVVLDEEGRYVGTMPTEDVVIAQVLALRTDEEAFRRTANITPMRRAA